MQELQRRDVEPVQVVGDQQQRRPGSQQRPGERREQALALLGLGQRFGPRHRRSSGSSRLSSARSAGSRRCSRAANASERSQATTGPNATAPSAGYARASAQTAPACSHHDRSSSTSRLLPMPGSPVTSASWALPRRAERQSAASRARSAPPADERRPGRRGRAARAAVRFGIGQQQRLVRRPRRRRRLDAELPLHRRGVRVVDAQRPRSVAARVVEAHQRPMRVLAQRVGARQPLGAADRRRPTPRALRAVAGAARARRGSASRSRSRSSRTQSS